MKSCGEERLFGSALQGVLLFSLCLDRNLPHMFKLWSDIFNRYILKQFAPPDGSYSCVNN